MGNFGETCSDILEIWRQNKIACLCTFLVFLIPLGFAAYQEFVVVPKLSAQISRERMKIQTLQSNLQKAEHEREQGHSQLKLFQVAADRTFPNTAPEERIELLGKFTEAMARLQVAAEKSTPDRIMGPDLKNALVMGLKGTQPLDVELTSPLANAEGFAFASQIKAAFEAAGWRVNDVDQEPLVNANKQLRLFMGKPPSPELQKALEPLLSSYGEARQVGIDNRLGEGNLRIVVGAK